LARAVAQLSKLAKDISLDELRNLGVSSETLWRTIVVSFGAGASIFEALSPETYVVKGETKPPEKLGLGFK
jgi:hypothetical protein